jgi:hypothetical protein
MDLHWNIHCYIPKENRRKGRKYYVGYQKMAFYEERLFIQKVRNAKSSSDYDLPL